MDEFVVTIVGDLEVARRLLIRELQAAQARIAELEAQLAEKAPKEKK